MSTKPRTIIRTIDLHRNKSYNPSKQINKRLDSSYRIKSICLNKEHSCYNNTRRHAKSTLEKTYKELQLEPLNNLKCPPKNTSILQGFNRYGLEDIVPHSEIKMRLEHARSQSKTKHKIKGFRYNISVIGGSERKAKVLLNKFIA